MTPALDGVRVLDLTAMLPGAFASQILADLGATVVKVERRGAGDPLRHLVPHMYASINRGKHSVALDLKRPDDLAVLHALLADADVLMEGFRPGVLDRLGLSFDAVRERQGRIVYVSLSGWGKDGPAAAEAGHNGNFLARAGATFLTGDPGGPPTDAFPIPVADLAAALYAVVGVLAALRDTIRAAVHLDVSLFASALALMTPRLAEYAGSGFTGRDEMMARPANGVFRTGDGRHVLIAAVEDHFWQQLCRAINRPDLADDPSLASYQDRFARRDLIAAAIEAALATGSRDEWVGIFTRYGVPASPVLEPGEVAQDEQVRHLGLLAQWPQVTSFLPILGLATRQADRVSGLDEDGAAIRCDGWPA